MEQSGEKLIIVEGKTDKKRILPLLDEPVEIVCTHGTLSFEKMEELINYLEDRDVYILVDADEPGNKLRNQLIRELPNAKNLYIKKLHKEVARAPIDHLLHVLEHAHFKVNEDGRFDLFK
jgi:toprim domain protein